MTETEVRKSGCPALTGKLAMEDVSRAFKKGETEGCMKILVDAETKEILAASFLEAGGDEAIHCVLAAVCAKAPYTLLRRATHVPPTGAEFVPAMLNDLVTLPSADVGWIARNPADRNVDGWRAATLTLRGRTGALPKANHFIVCHKLARSSRARLQVKHDYKDRSIG